jgi:hypothetical protein
MRASIKGNQRLRLVPLFYQGEEIMGGTIHLDDLTFADAIAIEAIGNYGIGTAAKRNLWPDMTEMVNKAEKERASMNTYEKQVIKNFMNIEYGLGASIDQLITAYGYFGAVIDRVKEGGYEVPKELQTAFDSCERDLKTKITDNRKAKLESLKRERDALASAEEKRSKIDAEITKLEELVK